MARPAKTGLDYYPMDVGFLRDKKVKLLRTEFGASSVLFVLYVLGKVYEGEGYFLVWDKDELLLAADELHETPTFISEVLKGCLKRSLFDEWVFQVSGVLTSAGIQRRYLRGCEKRGEITMIDEYWLLNVDSKDDVPAGIRAKLAFVSVSGGRNEVISPGNPVDSPGNPQSKVKESRVKESRVIGGAPPASAFTPEEDELGFGPELTAAFTDWIRYRKELRKPLTKTGTQQLVKEIHKYVPQYGEAAVAKLLERSMSCGWQGIFFEQLEKPVSKGPSASVGEVDWMRDIIRQRSGGDGTQTSDVQREKPE